MRTGSVAGGVNGLSKGSETGCIWMMEGRSASTGLSVVHAVVSDRTSASVIPRRK